MVVHGKQKADGVRKVRWRFVPIQQTQIVRQVARRLMGADGRQMDGVIQKEEDFQPQPMLQGEA
jgi:hypothetical protein